MFEIHVHFVLLISNPPPSSSPIKRLKSRTQKRHSGDHSHFYHSASRPHLLTIPFIDQSVSHSFFSHPASVLFFALTQSQIQSSSTLPRSHSLSEAFGVSVYHFVHAFINYLPIHFFIIYSLLFRCNVIEPVKLNVETNINPYPANVENMVSS